MGISIGLVGLGAFGSAFADLFMSHPLVDRIGLCDLEPERIAAFANKPTWRAKFSLRDAYTSLDGICRSDLDALVIITQPWLHAPQCIQAMEAGKHVYSAVPVIQVPDGDEILEWCTRLVDTCRRSGMHYMLGETTYYRPQTMFCRRRAADGAFGGFTYSEGEYLHDIDSPTCSLRELLAARTQGSAGNAWITRMEDYRARGVQDGPMHYPTHSTSGPISVMHAHAVKVCGWGTVNRNRDRFYEDHNTVFSNETALFQMSNGATMRICEHREIGHPERETFRLYGTQASFENDTWADKDGFTPLTIDQMRDPLPDEVRTAFLLCATESDIYGGHGGSHPYLVHEFVDAVAHGRTPAINAWEAVRYMAAGVMAHKSALRDGEILAVPDWGDAPQ